MTRPLDQAELNRLVSAFLRIESMRARQTRDLYFEELERALGHPLGAHRYDEAKHDVWSLIRRCLRFPGAVHTLMAVLEEFYPGSRSVGAARAVVGELLAEPLLDPRERGELSELVRRLESRGELEHLGGDAHSRQAALTRLYWRAVGPIGPTPRYELHRVQDVVARLEEATTGADGVPPLLTFVSDLAGDAGDLTAKALRDWTARLAERLGLPPDRLDRLWPSGSKALLRGGPDTFLVIECRPDGADPDRILATAWLQLAGEPSIRLRDDDRPRPPSGLPGLVEELLVGDARVVGRENAELTVEFVLPRHLFNLPFDQFRITVHGLERRLGIEYAVVLRSLDRWRHPDLLHQWRLAWRRFLHDPGSATLCRVSKPREHDGERLFTMVSEHPSAGLAMAFPPWGQEADSVDELWIGLQAGAPIIVWCREGRDPVRFAEETRELLDSGLPSLPQKVFALRRRAVLEAGAGHADDHLGLHLALLFDDADRVPEPYTRLKPPT